MTEAQQLVSHPQHAFPHVSEWHCHPSLRLDQMASFLILLIASPFKLIHQGMLSVLPLEESRNLVPSCHIHSYALSPSVIISHGIFE